MSYIGDFAEDYATLNTKFTTVGSDGASTVLAGTPAISVYKANGTTQSTAGITLSVDFDSVVGLNNVLIDLSADAFYAVGNDYQIVITTGTVGGTSVVGYVVGEFSIENRFMRGTDSAATASALTTHDGKLDTAQLDLDTLTGADGATLATTQGNYAPNVVVPDAAGVAPTAAEIFTAVLTTQLSEAYSTKGSAPTAAQFMFEVLGLLRERSVTGTTETINGIDGATAKMTNTLGDATSPTSVTRAT